MNYARKAWVSAIILGVAICWAVDVAGKEMITASSSPVSDVTPSLPIIEINKAVHINTIETWRNAHYRIHGGLVLEKGGILFIENCVVELMCEFARQYTYRWEGGVLISTNSTLGGTSRNGIVTHSNFEVLDGEWYSFDTTIQYCYGIGFSWEEGHVGKIRATRLIAGRNPDALIMGGNGDVILKNSTYAVALTISSADGGNGRVDMPINTSISQVYDSSNVLGATYRLELINTQVTMWFLFANIVGEGPPAEIAIANAPKLIPSVSALNLKGELRLPCDYAGKPGQVGGVGPIPPHTTFTTGNLTWRIGENPVGINGWGLYFTGRETDVTVKGPIRIAELMLFDAKRVVLDGDKGTCNIWAKATTIEVDYGHVNDDIVPITLGSDGNPETVRLEIRDAAIGPFNPDNGVRGQIGALGNADILIENSICNNLLLHTKHQGRIILKNIEKQGELILNEEGGDIIFENENAPQN